MLMLLSITAVHIKLLYATTLRMQKLTFQERGVFHEVHHSCSPQKSSQIYCK